MHGINLGGWLVLERWINKELFAGTTAQDEYEFMQLPGARQKLERHREMYVREEDFAWMREAGVELVRIPLGYWVLEDKSPYASARAHLDFAMKMAQKYNLKVLLGMHAAPGGQNSADHSGHVGERDWFGCEVRQQVTIDILCDLARRYNGNEALWGIELLNEPDASGHFWELRRFYRRAYRELCGVMRPGVYTVFHDGFRPLRFAGIITPQPDHPVAMDVHWYSFSAHKFWRSIPRSYIRHTVIKRRMLLWLLQRIQPVLVGEWSLVLPDVMMHRLSKKDRLVVRELYGKSQLRVYKQALGWAFWTYLPQNATKNEWNARIYEDLLYNRQNDNIL